MITKLFVLVLLNDCCCEYFMQNNTIHWWSGRNGGSKFEEDSKWHQNLTQKCYFEFCANS
jgi:hypothetical protein